MERVANGTFAVPADQTVHHCTKSDTRILRKR